MGLPGESIPQLTGGYCICRGTPFPRTHVILKEMGVGGEKGGRERLPALGVSAHLETVAELLRKNIHCVDRNTQLSLQARLIMGSFFPPSWSQAVSSCVSRHGDVTEYALLHTPPASRQQALPLPLHLRVSGYSMSPDTGNA